MFLPALFLLASCAAVPQEESGVSAQLAALRKEVEHLKARPEPFEMAFEMTNRLAEEMQRLRFEVAKLGEQPSPPPVILPPPRPAGRLSIGKVGDTMGAPGGTYKGITDLFWVLSRLEVGDETRTVLCLYRAHPKGFNLMAVRWLDYDMRIVQYNSMPSVADIKKAFEDEAERQKKGRQRK
ncbi:MAG: hypothetical protein ACYTAF_11620 [Planctomycetota bacterium]